MHRHRRGHHRALLKTLMNEKAKKQNSATKNQSERQTDFNFSPPLSQYVEIFSFAAQLPQRNGNRLIAGRGANAQKQRQTGRGIPPAGRIGGDIGVDETVDEQEADNAPEESQNQPWQARLNV